MKQPVRNIFVVGPDGTGKTEVSTRLAKLLGYPRFKCPSEKEMFKNGTFKESLAFDLMLPHLAKQTDLAFVSDRGYPCEWAYAGYFSRPTDFDVLRRIDQLWAHSRRALIVLLTMDDWSRAREDDLVKREDLVGLANSYRGFLDRISFTNYMEIVVDRFGDLWADEVAHLVAARIDLHGAVAGARFA